MRRVNVPSMDMNLLVALEALLDERNVSRAAKRLGMSQPGMSNALSRLRKLLGDPLLVRVGHEMISTPRGKQLLEPVRKLLTDANALLAGEAEEEQPPEAGTVRLGANDYVQAVLLPRLEQVLARQAPRLQLHALATGEETERYVQEGRVDLAICGVARARGALFEKKIFDDENVVIAAEQHPRAGRAISSKQLVNERHVALSPRGDLRTVVDDELEKHGLARRVAVTTASYLSAFQLVASSELLAIVPRRLASAVGQAFAVRVLAPPIPLGSFSIRMVWSEARVEPSMRWLRSRVVEVAADVLRESTRAPASLRAP
jgi:DNA-binding transcriptional LysR family regulator